MSITVNAVNDAPVAVDDSYSTNEDVALVLTVSSVLDNDSDVDGDELTAVEVSDPANGSVTVNGDGTFSYTPDLNFNGEDSFTYEAGDGNGGTDTATVTITVNAVNDAPVADGESYTTDEDTVLSEAAGNGVLVGDTDVEASPLTAILVSGPSHGTLTFNANGSFTYTPAANYNGPDSFTYKANDGSLDSNVATVSITVNAVNDAPVVTVEVKNSAGTWMSASSTSAQYSDPFADVRVSATDVDNTLGSIDSDRAFTGPSVEPHERAGTRQRRWHLDHQRLCKRGGWELREESHGL